MAATTPMTERSTTSPIDREQVWSMVFLFAGPVAAFLAAMVFVGR